MSERIQDRMVGRWGSVLPLCGIPSEFLKNKHGPCPMCGGKDRFRYDDRGGNGTWYCSHCGAGNGVDLVMKFKGIPFIDAKREIERHIGESFVTPIRASKSEAEKEEKCRDQMAAVWGRARFLDGHDLASQYLISRGIWLDRWPPYLRYVSDLPHYAEGTKERTIHPAMLAKFAAPDGTRSHLHRTYLTENGKKAALVPSKSMMPGKTPSGGAVRLFPAGETLGIAEGIETALSAAILFGVPVWSALTSGGVARWVPPKSTRCVMIFADNDANFAGLDAAGSLAHRLSLEGVHVDLRLPADHGDWNDELASQGMPREPFRLPGQIEVA